MDKIRHVNVSLERDGQIARVAISRPSVLNALSEQTHTELRAAWDAIEDNPKVRVAILSGIGGRAFSVGQDLRETAIQPEDQQFGIGSQGRAGHPRLTEPRGLSVPIIAAVDGYALGGGLELTLACDIVLSSTRSTFGLPEPRRGLFPGAGGAFRLPAAIPQKVAMGMLLSGRPISAARAYEIGLVTELSGHAELDSLTNDWASSIAECSPTAVRAIKEAAMELPRQELEKQFGSSYIWEAVRKASGDPLEGAQAFLEHRPPMWSELKDTHPRPSE